MNQSTQIIMLATIFEVLSTEQLEDASNQVISNFTEYLNDNLAKLNIIDIKFRQCLR